MLAVYLEHGQRQMDGWKHGGLQLWLPPDLVPQVSAQGVGWRRGKAPSRIAARKGTKASIKHRADADHADHVHLFVKAPPALPPHYIVGQLKGYSSRILRKEFDHLRSRLPSRWTRSYYVETVGHISEQTVQQDIVNQKNR